jgi:hypothetical protein
VQHAELVRILAIIIGFFSSGDSEDGFKAHTCNFLRLLRQKTMAMAVNR